MSLLGDLANEALSGTLGGPPPQGADTQTQLLHYASNFIQQQGGVQGLMAKFQQAGLGEHIASWVGNGANLPISADQIKAVLGEHVDQIAQQTGQDPKTVAGGLAQILPSLVDKLSPNGQPATGNLLESGLQSVLKGGLGKLFSGA